MTSPGDRYRTDVLASGWQRRNKIISTDLVIAPGLVVEDPTSGFCGAVIRWENGLVVLEDRHGGGGASRSDPASTTRASR